MKKAVMMAAAAVALQNETVVDRCGTEHNDEDIAQSVDIAERTVAKVCAHPELKDLRVCQPLSERVKKPVTIPVWYHILHAGSRGLLTQATIDAQFQQTNKDFAGKEDPTIPGFVNMDITFAYAGSTFTDNANWFNDQERYETQIKNALAKDSTKNFNQYMGDFGGAGLLGFCYFPNSFSESSPMHGCMNLYSSVPGGASDGYNQGKTTTHETGHAIGLYHTFQGGCSGAGDQVADTCNQRSATNGCPVKAPDSCGKGCPDNIHNYMDYSTDTCMTQFTPGQNSRANQQLFTYRPSLYGSSHGQPDMMARVEKTIPGIFDEARAHGAASEGAYMAKRAAKGY